MMLGSSGVTADLPRHLGRDHLGLGGNQGLTHLARLLVTLLLWNRVVGSHWNRLARLKQEWLLILILFCDVELTCVGILTHF